MPAMSAYLSRRRGHRPPVHVPARLGGVLRRGAAAVAFAALVVAFAAVEGPPAGADELPRFVSLKAGVANLRVGPGRRYPIDWVYERRGLPLLVIQRFDQWRWVSDHEGTRGWMHKSLLSTHRTALIVDGVQTIREHPLPSAPAVLRAEAGVIADLLGCKDGWCRIALAGEKGWVPERSLWGAAPPAR